MEITQITNGIRYIGVDDLDLDLFEGQYEIPLGMSYNSYLIEDDKIAIMDTVDARKTDEWIAKLDSALAGRTPDYLIIHHVEPDHAGNIKYIMDRFPNCVGVCSQKAVGLMKRFFDVDFEDRLQTVKEGDTLSLGERTLQFMMAPMVHWPEVMVSYEQKDKVLFSADAFGKFGALSREEEDEEGWSCEARRYYFNICGKYGNMVQGLLKKVAQLDVKIICSLHGSVLTENLDYYIGLYDTWSKYEPENEGIFIAYSSLHGNTEKAALTLASIIKEMSDIKVSVADLRHDDMHEAIEDAFRYDRMVVAAPTYDGGLMPIMEDFISHLKIKMYQNRKVGIIENGSWAPVAGKKMREAFETMKNVTILEPMVTVESTVKPNTVEALKELAKTLVG
ncbi:MAG: MBL fold metallo-hydrolase [Bacteroidaceae bacterium]|nr:MBL fold metallo-hydrolase [Bacteroidaceae bacterium]